MAMQFWLKCTSERGQENNSQFVNFDTLLPKYHNQGGVCKISRVQFFSYDKPVLLLILMSLLGLPEREATKSDKFNTSSSAPLTRLTF